jgi:hypothetical protein
MSQRVRALVADRVTLALVAVFLFAAAFYLWRANYAIPLTLHSSTPGPYNQLAEAFLHLHLWVARVPASLLGPEPLNPSTRPAALQAYPDYSLYGEHVYITWGPAPVLVLLLPLHLLGFEPSASWIIAPFAIVGLGFALASLRVILRQIDAVPRWMCVLAALTVALASVLPYALRFSLVYHQAIAAGYCFAMAGLWLALSTIAARRASIARLALMSLCFGLAAGSRPPLAFAALVLAPVYLSLRSMRPRRSLLAALALPFGACLLALAAYNQARFGSPLNYGTQYQLGGSDLYGAHFGALSYLPPGLWFYLLTPPRIGAMFPFIFINYPQVAYPLSLPAHYYPLSEETGGLLAMAPISLFLPALPWIWRRGPALLGALALPLLAAAAAGVLCLLFLSYEFFSTTERYATDYTTLLLLGALAAWLALSSRARGRRRWLLRAGGALLAVWGCMTGIAISLQELQKHPGTWRALVNLSSPLATAITAVAGHPVLAEVEAQILERSPASYTNIGTEATGFSLDAGGHATLTIISPSDRTAELAADVTAGPALAPGASLAVRIRGPGDASHSYPLPAGGGHARIPVSVRTGVNRLVLSPIAGAAGAAGAPGRVQAEPDSESESESEQEAVMVVANVHLLGG